MYSVFDRTRSIVLAADHTLPLSEQSIFVKVFLSIATISINFSRPFPFSSAHGDVITLDGAAKTSKMTSDYFASLDVYFFTSCCIGLLVKGCGISTA